MFNRTAIFALAAFASLTTAIVAPTTASALGHGSHFGSHFGGRHFGGVHFGQRFRQFGRFSRWSRHDWRWSRWERYRWYPRGPLEVGGPMVEGGGEGGPSQGGGSVNTRGGGKAPVKVSDTPRKPAAPENCLTKQYKEDGTVLFQDRCTGEEAVTSNEQEPTQEPPTTGGRRFRR